MNEHEKRLGLPLRRLLVEEWDTFLGWALLVALLCGMLLTWFWLNPLNR